MSSKNERLQILEMIEQGVITANEGVRLLEALGASSTLEQGIEQVEEPVEPSGQSSAPTETTAPRSETQEVAKTTSMQEDLTRWRRWWLLPFWSGVIITLLGAGLMAWAIQNSGLGWWFTCAWLPFALGLALMVLSWGSRSARWLHVRIRQKPGKRPQSFVLSFPLPIHLTAWFLRTFGPYLPHLQRTGLDEVLLGLKQSTFMREPFFVEVDEGEGGERIEVYIG